MPVTKNFTAKCPSCNEDLHAEIRREMHGFWRICATDDSQCHSCGNSLDEDELKYKCHNKSCDFNTICVGCTRQQLGLPTLVYEGGKEILKIVPGDILLGYGNADTTIHHAMLVQGPLIHEPLDMMSRRYLELEPGVEVWGCRIIESSDSLVGVNTWWHPSMILFTRCLRLGTAFIVGCLEDDESLVLNEEPTPFKVCLHPLRKNVGGVGVDRPLFKAVVQDAANHSTAWKMGAGLVGNVALRVGCLDAKDFPTEALRSKLLQDLKQDWTLQHVCSGVPVQVWQRYFVAEYEADAATQMILRYMPVKASNVVPSQLVIELSKCHWSVQSNLEPHALYR